MVQKYYLEQLDKIATAIQKQWAQNVDLSQLSVLNSEVSNLIDRISKNSININVPIIYSAIKTIDTSTLERALEISIQITN
jgi:hypothetical protein